METNAGNKAIAIIIPGGIGTGPHNIGVPALELMVKNLATRFDVTVFSLFKVNADYIPQGFKLVSIEQRNIFLRIISLFGTFIKYHWKTRFCLVHGYWAFAAGFLAVILARLLGLRSVVTVMGGDAIAIPEIKYGLLRSVFIKRCILFALRAADEVILVSAYLEKKLREAGVARNFEVIPMPVDPKVCQYRKKEIVPPVRFLHVGNLIPVKDQRTLLHTFHLISSRLDARLIIVGVGPLSGELRALSDALRIADRVTWVEPMPPQNLAGLYAEADVLLHSSVFEGQPVVASEALTIGLVVAGTSVGILNDSDCCIVAPVKDSSMLANQVIDVLSDKNKLATLIDKAENWRSSNTLDKTIDRISAIYDRLKD